MTARKLFSFVLLSLFSLAVNAVDPTATNYSWSECQGTALPYPAPAHPTVWPDTLEPVMINHVGRHGARFPASPRNCNILLGALGKAEADGTITPQGRRLKKIAQSIVARVNGRWGALDSLGMAEQRGIAARMMASYPELFKNSLVNAISSYSPRCVMSMDEFTHQLTRMDNTVELDLASGRRFSPLMRFFDNNAAYTDFRTSDELKSTIHKFMEANCPTSQLNKVLGSGFDFSGYTVPAIDIAMAEFSVLAGMKAMGMEANVSEFLNPEEQNRLWAVENLRHYLQHSASTLSAVPSEIAAPLLEDLIATTEAFINGDRDVAKVNLRFGHAETLMPLFALMRLPGCYYLTNYFDTVALHWLDFNVVPMAANLQMILFKSESGRYYLRIDHNERPVAFMPNSQSVYVDWNVARDYFRRCLPLF
ncbi:MAG: hypothetical protein K2G01_02425 [Paramuribaculum sp.]|nr:hypothetical protein [Paramuribaculum sp.]